MHPQQVLHTAVACCLRQQPLLHPACHTTALISLGASAGVFIAVVVVIQALKATELVAQRI